jgi:hypothetical protein
MTAPTRIEADGPTQSRATVAFKNWKDEHGLVIRKDKLEQDAKNFRRIAKLLSAGGQDQEHVTFAAWMLTLADQFQNASCGYDAQAQETPYDKPPETAAAPGTATETKEATA